jgi:aspartyl-tRNA(Asn)/glutamyl-tRNA(Gln) amidotransferase subunit C
MAKLSKDDVLKLASLARLELTDAEAATFEQEINEILGYVEQLQAVDVSGLEPTTQVTGSTNITRPDEVIDYGYAPLDLLKNAPAVEDNQIKVKRMVLG